jgi:hypothetical protein
MNSHFKLLLEDKMKKLALSAICLSFLFVGPAQAKDINFTSALSHDAFKNLSEEAGAAFAYRNTKPASPLGVTGFDIGVEASMVDISTGNNNYWEKAFAGDAPGMLVIPKIRARKGLPLGFDVGAMYAPVPGSNISLYGAELSYAILEGSIATPALGVRGSYTKLAGVNDLDVQTFGLDVSVSKGFPLLTPYGGAGMVHTQTRAEGSLQRLSTLAGSPLGDEKKWHPRYFVGLELSPLPLLGITAEVEYMNRTIYSLRVAFSF